jgi:hypothetical protein
MPAGGFTQVPGRSPIGGQDNDHGCAHNVFLAHRCFGFHVTSTAAVEAGENTSAIGCAASTAQANCKQM